MCDGTNTSSVHWKRVTKPEFTYAGSCLGAFQVKNAIVWECDLCAGIMILASIARGWEVEKALEIIEIRTFYSDKEIRFLRELCKKTPSELAVALDLPKEDVLRLEKSIGSVDVEYSRLLARYFLRREGCLTQLPAVRAQVIKDKVRMESED